MAKEKDNEVLVDVDNVLDRAELYFEENKQRFTTIAVVLFGLIGGYLAYKYLYIAGEEEAAAKEMFRAEQFFAMENYEAAINGNGGDIKGFSQIVDEYSATPSGNLAQYYLGISLLKTGKFEEAIEHLEEFDGKDQIVGPQATGAIGDAYLELGQFDEAITFYLKAAEQSPNAFTSPVFLKKAALVNEEKGSCITAVQLYERIKNEYPQSEIAKDMDKYIARAKVMGNLE
jgi:tetratricopeptide (TPR) repeat protein